MKFGVVIFPGSNCDQDMIHVLRDVMNSEVIELWHKEKELVGFETTDCIVLPGGFSYGDYLRSGAIARFSPIMNAVIDFANNGGLVLGVCNGFQVLCESGLLPGALLRNINQQFICENLYIRSETTNSKVTSATTLHAPLKIPIAHAEGRYFAKPEVIRSLKDNDQILFSYCDEEGKVSDATNPNGSTDNIAGICNEGRNVFGMMPHPERAAEGELGNEDGKVIFQSLLNSVLQPA